MRAVLALIALLLAFPAVAHQQKNTISVVSHNPRTEMLEVVHRIPVHDAEHALRTQGIKIPDILADIDSRRAFARYVAERFEIASGAHIIRLTLLGTEIDGRMLLVYQEASSPGPGTQLRVNSQILTDVWARQENRVNIGIGTSVDTLIFRAGNGAKSAILP